MTLETSIFDLIQPLAGCFCIWADQDAPAPVKPYMAFRVGASAGPENENYLQVDAGGAQKVESHRDIVLEIQCYGPNSMGLLEILKQKLRWSTTGDAASRAGLAVFDHGPVHNVSLLLDTAFWEPRAMLEIGIRHIQSSADQVGLITTVNITGTVTGGATPSIDASVTVENP